MRLLFILLIACVALAALKFAVIALAIVLAISFLWGAFAHPAETFGLLLFGLLARAFAEHTVAALATVGMIGFGLLVREGLMRFQRDST